MESSEESLSPVGDIVGGVSVLEVAAVVVVDDDGDDDDDDDDDDDVVGIITGPVARPTVASLLCCTPTQILLHNDN